VALPGDCFVDAVLVRPAVLRPVAGGGRSLGRDAARAGTAARREGTREAAPGGVEEAPGEGHKGDEGYEGDRPAAGRGRQTARVHRNKRTRSFGSFASF